MKGVGRNDPCPCGSGKKYKKCCHGKLPRDQYVYIGHREKFQGITVENDQVLVHLLSGERVKADLAFSQTQYTGKTGKEKVLSRIPVKAAFNPPLSLASDFDVFWAIDTNTKRVGGEEVSISCILECYAHLAEPTRVDVAFRKYANIVFRNCPEGAAERYGWYWLIKAITSNPRYGGSLRIGVITDHDLARHSEYNAGELPIHGQMYLPPNFTLMYATSDAGKENVLNTLIMKCNTDATGILRQLEETGRATIDSTTITMDQIPDLRNSVSS